MFRIVVLMNAFHHNKTQLRQTELEGERTQICNYMTFRRGWDWLHAVWRKNYRALDQSTRGQLKATERILYEEQTLSFSLVNDEIYSLSIWLNNNNKKLVQIRRCKIFRIDDDCCPKAKIWHYLFCPNIEYAPLFIFNSRTFAIAMICSELSYFLVNKHIDGNLRPVKNNKVNRNANQQITSMA